MTKLKGNTMNESYPYRNAADPERHKIYSRYLQLNSLDNIHFHDLQGRGLNQEQINNAGYASKPKENTRPAEMVLQKMDGEFALDEVPGFFRDGKTGRRRQAWHMGLLIPVRNARGKIQSLLIRNDEPKHDKNGRATNKYVAFSSNGKDQGAKVFQTTHCPIIGGYSGLQNKSTEIRITEGILKADVATALGDYYCIGLNGLTVHSDLVQIFDDLQICTVRICFDAGEDENMDMIRAKCELINLCKEQGIEVVVESWDPELGKGIDDVLLGGHADEIKHLSEEEINELLTNGHKNDPCNGDWIYCIQNQRFINLQTRTELRKPQFTDKFGLVDPKVASSYIGNGIDYYDKLIFEPGEEQRTEKAGETFFNLWTDPGIEAKSGDVSIFLDHIAYLFPDERDQNIVLDWLAFNVQYPGVKILWALVIQGGQGVGKSFVADVMRSILGWHNTCAPTNEEIHEKYTAWQRATQLVIIEELMASGRKELMNKLKPIITQETTRIREMNMVSYEAPNKFNLLCFTNYPNALLLDDDDRRYCILKTNAKENLPDYYAQLFGWTEEQESLQALLYYFKARDIGAFKAKGRAPDSEAKREMIANSRSSLEEWVEEHIRDNAWPFNEGIVCIRHLKDPEVCGYNLAKFSYQKWGDALRRAGSIKISGNATLSDKSRTTLWVFGDRKNILENTSLTELVKMYEGDEAKCGSENNPLLAGKLL